MLLSNTAISRPVFTVMVILALVVFGYVSFSRLGIDLMPDVEFPYVTITTVYPGADPETVETEVIERVEEQISTLAGIKTISSRAVENVGLVVIEYELDVNVDIATQDVRAKLDAIKGDLPKGAESPIVSKLDIGASSVLSLVISADMPLANLTSFVKDRIKPRLESVKGVGSVQMIGGREREIHVVIDSDAMRERDISIDEIIGILQISNLEIPGGRVETGKRELIVKTKGRIPISSEFENLIIKSDENGDVRLRDIADVKDTLQDKRTLARLDGKDAISLVVQKKSKANTVQVSDNVKQALATMRKELPPGIKITVPDDASLFIRSSFEELLKHLFYGGLFAVLVVFIFLRSPRSTIISAIAIPTSIISTFIFMNVMNFTLNIITMLGLSLSVGMLIDDAIVVLENIYRHMEGGEERMDAARNATSEIGLAVMATTFSIVAVFLPVAFATGIVGRFLYQFGMTVSFAVLISLFVSFTLTPMLASRFITPTQSQNWFYSIIGRMLKGLDHGYRELLRRALRYKLATVLVAVVIFIFSLFIGSRLPLEFQPNMDQAKFNITITTPPGSPITLMEEKITEVEGIVKQMDSVESTFSTVGTGAVETVTEGTILVNLIPKEKRNQSQGELANSARDKLTDVYGAKVKVSAGESHGFRAADIQVSIQGDDINQLISVTDNIVAELKKEPGFVDIDTSYESGKPEVKVVLDRDRASKLGLSVIGVATTVNGLVSGETVVTSFKEAGKDYDVKVRLKPELRDDPMDLLALPVRSMSGELLDLGSVAQIQSGSGPSEIDHYNRQRTVSVYSNLAGVPLGAARAKMEEILKSALPPGVTYTFVGLSEIMAESFQSLFFSMGLAIILIYMLLASQFENFLHPLSIMFSLPLSLIGALGGLYLAGMTISMLTLIGIIMLMGLVTKNAILLVDYTNTLRKRGLKREEALLQAGPIRLRPILMTTSAMVFGMLPVAIAKSSGAEIQAPMAICVIGGLITSMLLTLIVVPVVYSIFDSWVERISGKRNSDS